MNRIVAATPATKSQASSSDGAQARVRAPWWVKLLTATVIGPAFGFGQTSALAPPPVDTPDFPSGPEDLLDLARLKTSGVDATLQHLPRLGIFGELHRGKETEAHSIDRDRPLPAGVENDAPFPIRLVTQRRYGSLGGSESGWVSGLPGSPGVRLGFHSAHGELSETVGPRSQRPAPPRRLSWAAIQRAVPDEVFGDYQTRKVGLGAVSWPRVADLKTLSVALGQFTGAAHLSLDWDHESSLTRRVSVLPNGHLEVTLRLARSVQLEGTGSALAYPALTRMMGDDALTVQPERGGAQGQLQVAKKLLGFSRVQQRVESFLGLDHQPNLRLTFATAHHEELLLRVELDPKKGSWSEVMQAFVRGHYVPFLRALTLGLDGGKILKFESSRSDTPWHPTLHAQLGRLADISRLWQWRSVPGGGAPKTSDGVWEWTRCSVRSERQEDHSGTVKALMEGKEVRARSGLPGLPAQSSRASYEVTSEGFVGLGGDISLQPARRGLNVQVRGPLETAALTLSLERKPHVGSEQVLRRSGARMLALLDAAGADLTSAVRDAATRSMPDSVMPRRRNARTLWLKSTRDLPLQERLSVLVSNAGVTAALSSDHTANDYVGAYLDAEAETHARPTLFSTSGIIAAIARAQDAEALRDASGTGWRLERDDRLLARFTEKDLRSIQQGLLKDLAAPGVAGGGAVTLAVGRWQGERPGSLFVVSPAELRRESKRLAEGRHFAQAMIAARTGIEARTEVFQRLIHAANQRPTLLLAFARLAGPKSLSLEASVQPLEEQDARALDEQTRAQILRIGAAGVLARFPRRFEKGRLLVTAPASEQSAIRAAARELFGPRAQLVRTADGWSLENLAFRSREERSALKQVIARLKWGDRGLMLEGQGPADRRTVKSALGGLMAFADEGIYLDADVLPAAPVEYALASTFGERAFGEHVPLSTLPPPSESDRHFAWGFSYSQTGK